MCCAVIETLAAAQAALRPSPISRAESYSPSSEKKTLLPAPFPLFQVWVPDAQKPTRSLWGDDLSAAATSSAAAEKAATDFSDRLASSTAFTAASSSGASSGASAADAARQAMPEWWVPANTAVYCPESRKEELRKEVGAGGPVGARWRTWARFGRGDWADRRACIVGYSCGDMHVHAVNREVSGCTVSMPRGCPPLPQCQPPLHRAPRPLCTLRRSCAPRCASWRTPSWRGRTTRCPRCARCACAARWAQEASPSGSRILLAWHLGHLPSRAVRLCLLVACCGARSARRFLQAGPVRHFSRRSCPAQEGGGLQVTPRTESGRDAMLRAGVRAAMECAMEGNWALLDGQEPARFACGLAHALGERPPHPLWPRCSASAE